MSGRARACIDLDALQANLQHVRTSAPNRRVMAVIKADAYGHGWRRVAAALAGADALAVACVAEAVALREAGHHGPVVVLEGFTGAEELGAVLHHGLVPVLHHETQLRALEKAEPPRPLKIWFKLDSGMHRLGFPLDRVPELAARARACPALSWPPGWMTHFACADDRRSPATELQRSFFEQALKDVPGERSLANSAAILGWPASHADWVRPGIMLYGASPFIGGVAAQDGLRPVMRLSTRLIAVNRHRKGDAIGYGASWVCPEDMPVGVAAIGYGDGYPRHAPSGTPVLVNGREAPLIGRVSMDMITLDLRRQPEARVGDEVVCWGDGLAVERVAREAGTISYDLLCGITPRVETVFRGRDGQG